MNKHIEDRSTVTYTGEGFTLCLNTLATEITSIRIVRGVETFGSVMTGAGSIELEQIDELTKLRDLINNALKDIENV